MRCLGAEGILPGTSVARQPSSYVISWRYPGDPAIWIHFVSISIFQIRHVHKPKLSTRKGEMMTSQELLRIWEKKRRIDVIYKVRNSEKKCKNWKRSSLFIRDAETSSLPKWRRDKYLTNGNWRVTYRIRVKLQKRRFGTREVKGRFVTSRIKIWLSTFCYFTKLELVTFYYILSLWGFATFGR